MPLRACVLAAIVRAVRVTCASVNSATVISSIRLAPGASLVGSVVRKVWTATIRAEVQADGHSCYGWHRIEISFARNDPNLVYIQSHIPLHPDSVEPSLRDASTDIRVDKAVCWGLTPGRRLFAAPPQLSGIIRDPTSDISIRHSSFETERADHNCW